MQRVPLPRWAIRAAVAVWILYGCFHALLYLSFEHGLLRVPRAITLAVAIFVVGLVATALCLWTTERFPIIRARWLSRTFLHLVISLAVIIAQAFLFTWFSRLTRYFIPGDIGTFLLTGIDFRLLNYWAIVAVVHAYHYARSLGQVELERAHVAAEAAVLSADLATSRLQTLRMQLNPHFLFNALNTVSSLLYEDVDRANRMVVQIGEYLRRTLQSDDIEVTLAAEIDHVRGYIAIEQTRFGDKVEVVCDISADALEAYVPALLLQPLVENAFRHGRARGAGSRLIISGIRVVDSLVVTVSDHGPAAAAGGGTPGHGIGLENVRSRLRQLHGGSVSLVLEPVSDGTTVRVVMPYRLEPA